MSKDDLFEKIVSGEIAADILYQDKFVTAFKDINPQAPVHVLIVPNRNIPTVNAVKAEDEALLGKLFLVAKKLARELNIAEDGYRLIVNCNENGGQEVFHLHMHLLGGKQLGRMLSNI
jgi:histidine triad (HIT) family protein